MPYPKPPSGTVYLIHFAKPYCHAQHYLGFTTLPVEERIQQHRAGQSARFLQVVTEANINFSVARTWTGTRKLERSLKNHHNARRHCPLCNKTGH